MGLQGMINDLVEKSDFAIGDQLNGEVNVLHRPDGSVVVERVQSIEVEQRALVDCRANEGDLEVVPILGVAEAVEADESKLILW